ncbi:MAG TPA: class I SAM-dependent methyltransferase [Candidatus Nanoarchaeia archaeon]|nr:class I SAM-dependent methyltransferase [Candidatus Nanoarchaeia archaeon]
MAYIYKTGRAELHDQIKKHASVITGRVLDIGAGSYSRYQNLFKFTEYVRMDIAPGKGVDAVGTIESIPFPDNSFDSIVCTQVIGDVFDLEKAFAEIKRVLKPNGVALITESLLDPLHDEPHDFWRFTEHSLRALSIRAGFTVETVEKRGGFFSIMAQLKARYMIEFFHANRWFLGRLMSPLLKIEGMFARFLDRIDPTQANKSFTHGYILIIRKHA